VEDTMSKMPIFFKLMFPRIDPDFLINPQAEIYARLAGRYEPLTPMITEADWDVYIDHLIQELEQIRREGKRKFGDAKTTFKHQRT
jgi:hypothetical protein